MRKIQFNNDDYYHIYNRGVDKRNIFTEKGDLFRFLDSLNKFNTEDPQGGLYEISLREADAKSQNIEIKKYGPLVEFVAYCVNPNHYHFILRQIVENGISKFMHRLSVGYTRYFNEKYERTGSLFSGTYKAKYVDSNDYMLDLSAYVNLNYLIHGIELGENAFVSSSWGQYVSPTKIVENKFIIPCEKSVVLERRGASFKYKEFAEEYAQQIIESRGEEDKDGVPSDLVTTNRSN